MRSAPRWESRCSRRLPWRQAAGSQPATGTAWRSPRSGPRPAPAWRCTDMAAAQRTTGYQREVASRNVEAILDAAEELLRSQGHANISAVAAQAGVSRVTVYAHFPDWAAVLEAAVERAVRRTMTTLESARPEDGPP